MCTYNTCIKKCKYNLLLNVVFCYTGGLQHGGKEWQDPVSEEDVCVSPFRAGIDFRRQNLTCKAYPHTVRIRIFIMAAYP